VSVSGPTAVTAAWKVAVSVPGDAVDLFSDALRPFALSVAAFGAEAAAAWTVEAYLDAPPEPGQMAAAVALAAAAACWGWLPPSSSHIPTPAIPCT